MAGETSRRGSALVLGGTGMLAPVTRQLLEQHVTTVLVSRSASGFAPEDTRLRALDLDWADGDLLGGVGEVLAGLPALSTALLWTHDVTVTGALAAYAVARGTTRVVAVLASTQDPVELPAGVTVVRLGSRPTEDGGRRWLTDDEIAGAVSGALTDGQDRQVGDPVPAD